MTFSLTVFYTVGSKSLKWKRHGRGLKKRPRTHCSDGCNGGFSGREMQHWRQEGKRLLEHASTPVISGRAVYCTEYWIIRGSFNMI
jgi:hypothetical protein